MTKKSTTMRHTVWTATVVSSALVLAACTGHKKDATQSVARVDGTEITVHQLKYQMQRQRVRPDQEDAAAPKVLDQLIDEQLIVEKAEKTKMDLEPGARQALDSARRMVLARAYVEQATLSVPVPTEQAMRGYYDANPDLFANRRVFTLQEYLAKVPEAQVPTLRAMVEAGKPTSEVEAWFKAGNHQFQPLQSTAPAEQLQKVLKTLAPLPPGHGVVVSAGDQVHVTYVTSTTPAPVEFDKARQAIGQYLLNESRRKATDGNLAALRTSGKIDYAPQYAALAASGPALGTTKDIDAAAQIPASNGAHVSLPASTTSSGVQVTLPTTTTSSVQVSLPQTQGVRVSLPTTPASSVEVRLPAPTPTDAPKK